ncbi:MAG: flagellar hook assembly protein FlgD [Pseudomonadota bacterium]
MTELNPLGQTLPTLASASDTTGASNQLAENFDTFLTLLTEQLQNQDPLNPMEANEFVNQLVQFSSVEQQIGSNQALQSLLGLSSATARMGAVDYIGRIATASTDTAGLAGGRASWQYGLPREAESTQLLVFDQSGRLVRTAEGETGAGPHAFIWDGLDDVGNPLPDGPYRLEVVSRDGNDIRLDTPVRVEGIVTSVDMSSDEVIVELSGVNVPASQIIALRVGGIGV